MRSLIAAVVALGLMAAAPASAATILDNLPAGSIYADATSGVGGNTVNSATGSRNDYILSPPQWKNDGMWDHNVAPPNGNGGLDATGAPGGTSFYSNDTTFPAPMLTTTATGLDPLRTYNVYVAYYNIGTGVRAAVSGQTLQTYLSNFNIDTGLAGISGGTPATRTVKLAVLGQVSGVSSASVDVASAGNTFYDGVVVGPPPVLAGLAPGAIYVDAAYGAGGNTVNSATGSPVDFIVSPPTWQNNGSSD